MTSGDYRRWWVARGPWSAHRRVGPNMPLWLARRIAWALWTVTRHRVQYAVYPCDIDGDSGVVS